MKTLFLTLLFSTLQFSSLSWAGGMSGGGMFNQAETPDTAIYGFENPSSSELRFALWNRHSNPRLKYFSGEPEKLGLLPEDTDALYQMLQESLQKKQWVPLNSPTGFNINP